MGILDPAKLAVIIVLALIVVGPERLPGAARRLGAAWRTLTQIREEAEHEVRDAVASLDLPTLPMIRPSQMMSDLFTGDCTRFPLDDERSSPEPEEEFAQQASQPLDAPESDCNVDQTRAIGPNRSIATDRQTPTSSIAIGDASMN